MQRILIAGIDEPEIETVVVMSLIVEQHAGVTLDVELAVGVVLEKSQSAAWAVRLRHETSAMTDDLTILFPSLGPEQEYKHGTCQLVVKGPRSQ